MNKTLNTPTTNNAFTLIELLIVIGIISVLAIAVTIAINPAELLKQARDSNRLTDTRAIDSSLSLYTTDTGGQGDFGEENTVYISIPDTSSTCDNITDLPDLPSGWSYHCVTEADLTNTDSTGWIPVDLTQLSFGTPLSRLPTDPRNNAEDGLYYTYIAGSYIIEAPLESERERNNTGLAFTISTSQQPVSTIVPGAIRARGMNNGIFTDPRDGNEYRVTVIGSGPEQQVWFADNLRYEGVVHTSNLSFGGSEFLYSYTVAMDGDESPGSQGICPDGWHIPSDDDFLNMESFLGMSSSDIEQIQGWRGNEEGALLKVPGTESWDSETCGSVTCNLTGWNGVGSGRTVQSGPSISLLDSGEYGWWLASSNSSTLTGRLLGHNITSISRGGLQSGPSFSAFHNGSSSRYSIRCLRS